MKQIREDEGRVTDQKTYVMMKVAKYGKDVNAEEDGMIK